MKRYTLAITEEMEKRLEEERKRRLLDSIPETVRMILSEYFLQAREEISIPAEEKRNPYFEMRKMLRNMSNKNF
jgi:hypothetical protein